MSSHQTVNTSSSNSREVKPLQFIQGDVEEAKNLVSLNNVDNNGDQKFDLILCIEAMHCLTNFEAVLN
jgi:hypothetical protein